MLTAPRLLAAYAAGIFPMAESAEDPTLHWVDPPRRGVLPVGGVHASRSLCKLLRRGRFCATTRPDFDAVVAACAARSETWINAPLRRLYLELHRAGHAEAIEVREDGAFAGAIFGVVLGRAFFGESMVSGRPSGSRLALLWLSDHLARCGFTLLDTQFLTPHLASMGGIEIPRAAYRARLATAMDGRADFHAHPLVAADLLARLGAAEGG